MAYRFIDEYKKELGVRWLLRRLKLYPNGYYNYLKGRKEGYRAKKASVYEEIKKIYYNNSRITGHRGMKIFLARKGIFLSKATIHKYMNRELNLHAVIMKKKPRYVKGEKNKVFPNILNRSFAPDQKNAVWCTDFTYIRLSTGKMLYNCTIIDLYDRSVIMTLNGAYINTDLAVRTLRAALEREKPKRAVMLHSDQGCQYTSWDFVDFCSRHNIVQSMSRAGCPYDNAPMERFYNTLKNELINRNSFKDSDSLDEAVNQYAYLWYNHIRPHSFNNYLTPFEARCSG